MASAVGIFLCTFNGERFLAEQLRSIEQQTHTHWLLAVSDDGSVDATVDIVEQFRVRHEERVVVTPGPRQGFAMNFMSLTAMPPIQADYWAFCDQDDWWEADKLERAVSWLDEVPQDVPAIYCSRSSLMDSAGRMIGISPLFKRPAGFGNALVQNIASGNTMVFNERARRLLCEGSGKELVFHDWLLYLVVTGCGGRVFFDVRPSIRYRQHGDNVLGAWGSLRAHWLRAKLLLGGEFGAWVDANSVGLARIETRLMPESRASLAILRDMRRHSLVGRLCMLRKSGAYHQSWLGKVGLILAVILNKL